MQNKSPFCAKKNIKKYLSRLKFLHYSFVRGFIFYNHLIYGSPDKAAGTSLCPSWDFITTSILLNRSCEKITHTSGPVYAYISFPYSYTNSFLIACIILRLSFTSLLYGYLFLNSVTYLRNILE